MKKMLLYKPCPRPAHETNYLKPGAPFDTGVFHKQSSKLSTIPFKDLRLRRSVGQHFQLIESSKHTHSIKPSHGSNHT